MDSNTHSTQDPTGPTRPADDLAALTAVLGRLASRDPERLTDAALGDQTLQLQQLANCLDGIVLRHLAAVDARGEAGAEQGRPVWLHGRLVAGPARLRVASGAATTATTAVRTARALFRGPPSLGGGVVCWGGLGRSWEVLAASTLEVADQVLQAG